MKKYLRYLLLDIEAAKKNLPKAQKRTEKEEFDFFEGIEEYTNSPIKSMGEWFGLDARMFPPHERWTDAQAHKLVKALLKLWYIYNFDADFPKGIDVKLKYKLLVNALNEKVPWVSIGVITIDFCNSDTSTCLLEEHCICQEFVDSLRNTHTEIFVILSDPEAQVDISPSMQRYFEQLISDLEEVIRNLPIDIFDEEYEIDFDYFREEGEERGDFLDFLKNGFLPDEIKKELENEFSDEEDIEEEDEEEEKEQKPIGEWLGISKEVFPDLEQLSVNMRVDLVHTIEKLWWHAGYVPCFPEGLNIEKKYELFREHWEKVVPYPSEESVYISFCNENEDNCVYGSEMCDCRRNKLPWDDVLYEDNFDDLFLYDEENEKRGDDNEEEDYDSRNLGLPF